MFGQDYQPSITFPDPPKLLKIDRANMARLVVETEPGSLILSHVLNAIREHDALPFTIAIRRERRTQIIVIELRALPNRPAMTMLDDLDRLSEVRLARFILSGEQQRPSAIAAKA